ncbi:MAG: c-type cytochrome [Pseudomonadota bacterium]
MINAIKGGVQALLFAVFLVGTAQADETPGDAAAGKVKSVICQGCHGEDGLSVNPMCPNLAGQFPRYIEKQIRDFQREKRVDPIMTSMAASITEVQDAKDIAAYFSGLKRMTGKPSNSKMAVRGEEIFRLGNPETGLYGCINCHGDHGKGKSANNNVFPIIGGQTKAYLMKQLKDMRSGERSNDPAGMMGNIAKKMTDEEIEAVAEYESEQ